MAALENPIPLPSDTPEELVAQARGLVIEASCYTDPIRAMEALMAADSFCNLAIAQAATEQHLCGHGNRGWCPFCARDIQDNRRVN